jgi:hypothetical protein
MMRKRFLLIWLLIFIICPLLAQDKSAQDSLEQEILAHPESDLVLLGKTRAVLLDSFKAADTAKARKVVQYMESRFDATKMIVLYPAEQLLVAYGLNDFQKVLAFARNNDLESEPELNRNAPDPGTFYDDMIELLRRTEGRLRMDIRRSDLAPHEREFALLLLSDMLGQERGDQLQREAFQRKLNEEADDYLATYTNSEYNPYVRQYIRFVYVKSDWGYGLGGSLGYLALPNDLSRHLGDYVLFSLNLEGAYKQLYVNLGLDFGATHEIPNGFEYNGTWYSGMKIMLASGILAAGPMITLGGGFLAIPTVGISYMEFSQPDNEKSESANGVKMGFAAWALNASFRVPLGGEEGSSFISISAGYRQAMTSIELAKGGYTFVNVGYTLFDWPMLRDL